MAKSIVETEDGSLIAHSGPMWLGISVWTEGKSNLALARVGAEKAFVLLEELARFNSLISQNITRLQAKDISSSVVQRMIMSVRCMADETMTPRAAIAGSVADEVANTIFRFGHVSKVIVNNGGDIAIRLRGEESVKTGIMLDRFKRDCSYIITIDASSKIGGIATSGLGGRSFTKGIASAATAVASTASLADAAATLLANATTVDDDLIKRKLAEDIYPDTDIPGHWVTTTVGNISQSKIKEALDKGLAKVNELQQRGLIVGAVLAVKGQVRITETLAPILKSTGENGARG